MAIATVPPVLDVLSRKVRDAVSDSVTDRPYLQDWLTRVAELHPALDAAVGGIYCGRDGVLHEPIPGTGGHVLRMQWHAGRVEWAYIS